MAIQRRVRSMTKSSLSDSLRHFLMTGDYRLMELFPNCSGRAEVFRLANPSCRDTVRKVWELHRAEILRNWEKQKKKGLPWAAIQFDGREVLKR